MSNIPEITYTVPLVRSALLATGQALINIAQATPLSAPEVLAQEQMIAAQAQHEATHNPPANNGAGVVPPPKEVTAPLEAVSSGESNVTIQNNGDKIEVPAGGSMTTVVGKADSTVVLDKEGIPWDERIHSGNKGLKANGCWKRRKNITDELFNSVRAELLAPSVDPKADTETLEPEGFMPTPPAAEDDVINQGVTNPNEGTAPIPPPPAVIGDAPATFPHLLMETNKRGLSMEQLNAIAATVEDLEVFAELATHGEKIPAFWAKLNES